MHIRFGGPLRRIARAENSTAMELSITSVILVFLRIHMCCNNNIVKALGVPLGRLIEYAFVFVVRQSFACPRNIIATADHRIDGFLRVESTVFLTDRSIDRPIDFYRS